MITISERLFEYFERESALYLNRAGMTLIVAIFGDAMVRERTNRSIALLFRREFAPDIERKRPISAD